MILRTVVMEFILRRPGDVNPLILRLTMNQGTHVPRSPRFSPRSSAPRFLHISQDARIILNQTLNLVIPE